MKTVQLTENEVLGLCNKSRDIFLRQPILLELEAPLKICGECAPTERFSFGKRLPTRTPSFYTYSWGTVCVGYCHRENAH